MSLHIDLSQFTFPEKLWYLVNEPKCEHIVWGPEGSSIVILDSQEFSRNVLNNPSKVYFKTKNLSSFVRQLNLYGFRKVSDHKKVGDTRHDRVVNRCEFKHPCFRKDRKDLLEEVKRHQNNNNKKEESPSEEKPYTLPSNIPTYPSYFPANSMSSPYSMWSNWDPYLQAMGLFPYLPPAVGSQAGTFTGVPNQATLPSPGFYNRDLMGPSYGGYPSQYYQMPQCGYNEMDVMMNNSGIDTIAGENKLSDSNSIPVPTVKVTPNKPSVVIINNTLSSSRDVPTANGYQDKCEVSKPAAKGGEDSDAFACRGQEEAKKPIPAQRAEVSTTAKTGNVLQDCRIANSLSPIRTQHVSGNGEVPFGECDKTTAEKPFDKEELHSHGAGNKETAADFQGRKKIRLELDGMQ